MAEGPPIAQQIRLTIPSQKRLLLAVSGGIDSVVLLDICCELRQELSLQLEVAHVDHGLREDSSQDARFVSELAAHYGLPYHLLTAVKGDSPDGVEAWGRKIRYDYFSQILDQQALDAVLTAHHANDLAETVLMRFLANREPTSIHGVDLQRRIIRPLLAVRREQLVEYAASHQLAFREDPSNVDQSLLRNRYRRTIIPFLEGELSCDLIRILAERAQSLEDDATALEEIAREKLVALEVLDPAGREWLQSLRAILCSLPAAVSWRIVERVLASFYGDYLGRRTSLRVLEFILGTEVAIEVPGGHRIRRTRGGLDFM